MAISEKLEFQMWAFLDSRKNEPFMSSRTTQRWRTLLSFSAQPSESRFIMSMIELGVEKQDSLCGLSLRSATQICTAFQLILCITLGKVRVQRGAWIADEESDTSETKNTSKLKSSTSLELSIWVILSPKRQEVM
ncbi:hypothetical protein KIN20_006078 [Parelaphostrongylus tenuis]|uniref:Uncharacterized protein n=1 Tax=Parelaphostrongylus tenuis TaxID=148309 RepID=A0AAD5M5I0_PARTN|nr:hypothetical protein KIN20_006078 [Parelaphostrongylus tenuis]